MKYLYKNIREKYSINFDKEKIIEYKKDKMNDIPEEERIYSGISFNDNNKIINNKDRLYIKISPRKNKIFYLYKSKLDKKTKDNVLELYYNGIFVNLKCFKSDYLGETKYYLVDFPNSDNVKERKTFGSIIQVPVELYYLQLLLNEEYNLINYEEIDELRELFTIEKVIDIPINKSNINKENNNLLIKKLTRK